MMMSMDAAVGRMPLVLLVDPIVTSRHWMWRTLSRPFGVLEAGDARAARAWLAQRPDIDALVVQDELPDQRGVELVRELAGARHPVAARAIVLARPGVLLELAHAGATLIERGDLGAILARLASWFLARDAELRTAASREAVGQHV
jgi:hypothetical protein